MRVDNKIIMVKGLCTGFACVLLINFWVIISLYFSFSSPIYYLMGIPLGIIIFILLKQQKISQFFVAWGIGVVFFVLLETLVIITNTIYILYEKIFPNAGGMSSGEGFAILAIHFYNFAWAIIGTLFACIYTIIRQKKSEDNTS